MPFAALSQIIAQQKGNNMSNFNFIEFESEFELYVNERITPPEQMVERLMNDIHGFYEALNEDKERIKNFYELHDMTYDRYNSFSEVPSIQSIEQAMGGENKWDFLSKVAADIQDYSADCPYIHDIPVQETRLYSQISENSSLRYKTFYKCIEQQLEQNPDVVIHSENPEARYIAANKGFGLNELMHDPEDMVRLAVARHGYELETMIHDDAFVVRAEVARQGFGLDELRNDLNENVRAEVAKQGHRLDLLLYDGSAIVRKAVAEQGYGLEVLAKDDNFYISQYAKEQLLSSRDDQNRSYFEFYRDGGVSFKENKELMADFREMDKTAFLAANPDVTAGDYNATIYDLSEDLAYFFSAGMGEEKYIYEMAIDANVPDTLKKYSDLMKQAYEYDEDVEWSTQTREKAELLMKHIDRNQPFDFSKIHFDEEVLITYNPVVEGSQYYTKFTQDFMMYLSDRQYIDLAANRTMMIEKEFDNDPANLRSAMENGDLTLSAIALADFNAFDVGKKYDDIEVTLYCNHSDGTTSYYNVGLESKDKEAIYQVMSDYIKSQPRLYSKSFDEMNIDAKRAALEDAAKTYIQRHQLGTDYNAIQNTDFQIKNINVRDMENGAKSYLIQLDDDTMTEFANRMIEASNHWAEDYVDLSFSNLSLAVSINVDENQRLSAILSEISRITQEEVKNRYIPLTAEEQSSLLSVLKEMEKQMKVPHLENLEFDHTPLDYARNSPFFSVSAYYMNEPSAVPNIDYLAEKAGMKGNEVSGIVVTLSPDNAHRVDVMPKLSVTLCKDEQDIEQGQHISDLSEEDISSILSAISADVQKAYGDVSLKDWYAQNVRHLELANEAYDEVYDEDNTNAHEIAFSIESSERIDREDGTVAYTVKLNPEAEAELLRRADAFDPEFKDGKLESYTITVEAIDDNVFDEFTDSKVIKAIEENSRAIISSGDIQTVVPLTFAEMSNLNEAVKQIDYWKDQFKSLLSGINYEIRDTSEVLASLGQSSVNALLEDKGINTTKELVSEYPYTIYDTDTGTVKDFVNDEPLCVVESLTVPIEDYIEKDLRRELLGAEMPCPEEGCNYSEYIATGEYLKNSSFAEEREFYYNHKSDFEAFDLLDNHMEKISLESIVQRKTGGEHSAEAKKHKPQVDRDDI